MIDSSRSGVVSVGLQCICTSELYSTTESCQASTLCGRWDMWIRWAGIWSTNTFTSANSTAKVNEAIDVIKAEHNLIDNDIFVSMKRCQFSCNRRQPTLLQQWQPQSDCKGASNLSITVTSLKFTMQQLEQIIRINRLSSVYWDGSRWRRSSLWDFALAYRNTLPQITAWWHENVAILRIHFSLQEKKTGSWFRQTVVCILFTVIDLNIKLK